MMPTRSDALVRLLGCRALFLQGDPLVYDRWTWLRRHLRPGESRTLDAGCGNGAFTIYAASIGNRVVGLSFDKANNRKAAARAAILGIDNAAFEECDLRKLDAMRERLGVFDQVVCLETIEHIRDDRKLARDIAALLRPGGRLLLTTPCRTCKPLRGDKLSTHEDGGHVRWGYTHVEMRALLKAAGLKTIVEEYLNGIVSQQLTNFMRGAGGIFPAVGWAAVLPLRPLQTFDRLVTSTFGATYFSIAVVAEKAV